MTCEYEDQVAIEAANSEVGYDGTMIPNRENDPTSWGAADVQNQEAVTKSEELNRTTEMKIVKTNGDYVDMEDCINLLLKR